MACLARCNPIDDERSEDLLDPLVSPAVKEAMKDMVIDDVQLRQEMDIFLRDVKKGLSKDGNPTATIKCFPTFVQDLPNGTEKGKFLALDLGGSNFRVLLITLDVKKCEMESKVYVIPSNIMVGEGAALFDFIAKCLAEFAQEYNVANDNLPLGFTFSFPLTQNGLCSGTLTRWTKGFDCPDVINQDVVKCLIDAIGRRDDVKIDICAVLNDTTGTLMACAWKNPNCRIGLIIGTGSNACYYEKQENVELFNDPDMGSGKVIVNLECGAFGDDGAIDFLRTEEDKMLDAESIHPGKQIHEKCIAGMYLGELVRMRVLKLIEMGLLFDQSAINSFVKRDVFSTEMISDIESEPVGIYKEMEAIFNEIGVMNYTDQNLIDFRYVCQTVSRRAAHLVSAALAVLIKKMGEPYTVVGIDGSVYKHHPHVRRIMTEKMQQLLPPELKFKLMLSEDGSGRGAALVAAVAARKKKEMGG